MQRPAADPATHAGQGPGNSKPGWLQPTTRDYDSPPGQLIRALRACKAHGSASIKSSVICNRCTNQISLKSKEAINDPKSCASCSTTMGAEHSSDLAHDRLHPSGSVPQHATRVEDGLFSGCSLREARVVTITSSVIVLRYLTLLSLLMTVTDSWWVSDPCRPSTIWHRIRESGRLPCTLWRPLQSISPHGPPRV